MSDTVDTLADLDAQLRACCTQYATAMSTCDLIAAAKAGKECDKLLDRRLPLQRQAAT